MHTIHVLTSELRLSHTTADTKLLFLTHTTHPHRHHALPFHPATIITELFHSSDLSHGAGLPCTTSSCSQSPSAAAGCQ